MKVGILGTGDVGQTLGSAFAELGYEVKMGSRDAANKNAAAWAQSVNTAHKGKASHGTYADAAKFGELIVLAVLWEGVKHTLDLAGHKNFKGKIVIDATNPLKYDDEKPLLAIGFSDSGGEHVQRWLHDARVVKAFNTVGYSLMYKPKLPGGPPDMFICGDDAEAKTTVTEILKRFGWMVIDIGGIEGSRYLEPLCMLWVIYGFSTNTWDHAFKLLHK